MPEPADRHPHAFARQSGWPIVNLLFASALLALPAYAFGLGSYHFFVGGAWRSASVGEWIIVLVLTLGLCGYISIVYFVACLVLRRKVPLLVIEDGGIRLPHMAPDYLAWSSVADVEQCVIGGWTNLRLTLRDPERHLSTWRRRFAWPYGDSILVKIAMETSPRPAAVYNAVRDAHRRSFGVAACGHDPLQL